jgi:hypothetical protein
MADAIAATRDGNLDDCATLAEVGFGRSDRKSSSQSVDQKEGMNASHRG